MTQNQAPQAPPQAAARPAAPAPQKGELLPPMPADLTQITGQHLAQMGVKDAPVGALQFGMVARQNEAMARRVFSILATRPAGKNISVALAMVGYLYEVDHPGQQLDVHFFLDPKIGLVQGVLGIEADAKTRGVGPVSYYFREPTPEEKRQHEIGEGDTAVVGVFTQIMVSLICKAAHMPYEPIVELGLVKHEEKFRYEEWDDSQKRYVKINPPKARALTGGFTWYKKATFRARRGATKRMAGGVPDPDLLIQEFIGHVGEGALPASPDVLAKLDYDGLQQLLDTVQAAAEQVRGDAVGEAPDMQESLGAVRREQAEGLDVAYYDEVDPPALEEVPATLAPVEHIRTYLRQVAAAKHGEPTPRTLKWVTTALALLTPDVAERQAVVTWLFGPDHDLDAGECAALMEWTRPSMDVAANKMKLYGEAVKEFPQVLAALAAEAVSHDANPVETGAADVVDVEPAAEPDAA